MTDWNSRANDLFLQAAKLEEGPARQSFLDRECSTDPCLRGQIELLLKAHEQAGNFLHEPHPSVVAPNVTGAYEPIVERPGTIVGPYKLLQQIGEGGFGVVYMAEQERPVRRMVALKIIKPGMDTAQVIARFESERQALALMDHPNIAKVLDAGATDSGRPYFVMELVKGVPITEFCDKNHMPAAGRLKLFIDVCHAIQHAHHKGIIHRDIKPSNVMVTLHDGRPVVKVIDFGVAKATVQKLTERTLFTAFGQMIGTPAYMSPEQAEMSGLDIDTRSDVYSLGVLLYELLTGTTPLDMKQLREAGYAEMQRLIREEEAPRPSTRMSSLGDSATVFAGNRGLDVKKLAQLLAGDLDWVVMKALDKDRNRRYGTPGNFAEDIERYLNREAILARPPSTVYRLRKFAQRNRAAVATAVVVAAALLAGTGVATWQAVIATRAKEEALTAAAAEKVATAAAEAEKQKAENAEAVTLADYRASTDDAIEQLIGSKPELGPKEKAYLENTLKRWQAFAARQGDDEHSRAIRGEGHFHVAHLWALLGRREEARAEYQTSVDVQKKLVEQFPTIPTYQLELAKTQHNSAILLMDLGKRNEAMAEFQATCDLQKKLVEQFPTVPEYQQELARTHNSLACALGDLEKREEARAEYQVARDILKKLVEQFPAIPTYRQDLSRSHDNLAVALIRLGRREEARTEDLAARAILKKLIEQFPGNPEYRHLLAVNHDNLGVLFKQLGKTDEARAEYQAACDMEKELAEEFPALPEYRLVLARTHTHLGTLFASFGNHAEARVEYDTARDIQKKLVDLFPRVPMYRVDLALTYDHRGDLQYGLGKIAEARAEFQAARDIQKGLVDQFFDVIAYQQSLGTTHSNLGVMLVLLGKGEEGRAEYQAARDIQKKLVERFLDVPAYRHNLATTHINLGNLFARLGKHEEAWAEYLAARTILGTLAEQFPSESVYQRELGVSLCDTGNLVRDHGQSAESLEWFDRAIRTLQPVYDKEPRDVTAKLYLRDGHLGRAISHDRLQKSTEAIKDWDRAIELSPPAERPGGRARRATSRLQAGQVTEAVTEVAELTAGTPTWTAAEWYDFACVYAVAGGKIADKKQEYADRAMELLRKSVTAGNANAAHMKKDTDLDTLRDRADFKALIGQLKAPQK